MTAKNRAGLISKLQSALKKHYKPTPPGPGRPLLEHFLYAALLEDAPADLADEGYAKCEQEFFDWNEIRVTSVTELAEVFSHLPSPAISALRLKRCLQGVFETFYSFDIDHLKKENLGKAVAKFETMSGVTPFVLAYLVQHGLGGHAIPVNAAAIRIMLHSGIVSDSEANSGKVPGLERAIPKNKAIEFSSMLHQAAIAFAADQTDKTVWNVILAVNKDAIMLAPKTEPKRKSNKRAVGAKPNEISTKNSAGKGKRKGQSVEDSKADAASSKGRVSRSTKPTPSTDSDGNAEPLSTKSGDTTIPTSRRETKSAGTKRSSEVGKKASKSSKKVSTKKGSAEEGIKSSRGKVDPQKPSKQESAKKDTPKKPGASSVGKARRSSGGNQTLTKRKPR